MNQREQDLVLYAQDYTLYTEVVNVIDTLTDSESDVEAIHQCLVLAAMQSDINILQLLFTRHHRLSHQQSSLPMQIKKNMISAASCKGHAHIVRYIFGNEKDVWPLVESLDVFYSAMPP